MTKGQFPSISRGLGNLTPDMWQRLMRMLRNFEEGTRDETKAKSGRGLNKPFLAELTLAQCINPNRYIYAWRQVVLNDDNTFSTVSGGKTSTGGTDEWDFAAVNLMELGNGSAWTSAGVSMAGDYPAGWTMQAIGGGSCSGTGCEVSISPVVVLLTKVSGASTETDPRYVFSAVNEHDGTCEQHGMAFEDGIATPSIPSGATYGYIYISDSDGEPHWIDSDGNDSVI